MEGINNISEILKRKDTKEKLKILIKENNSNCMECKIKKMAGITLIKQSNSESVYLAIFCGNECFKNYFNSVIEHDTSIISDKKKGSECNKCHAGVPIRGLFSKCGLCKNVYYCSKNCQKQDWNEHKKLCCK